MARTSLVFISFYLVGMSQLIAFNYSDPLKIEAIVYNENIRFPFLISETAEMGKVADRINTRLQNIIFYGGEIINNNNLPLIIEHLYVQNDSIDQSGISSLDFESEFYSRFLKLTIQIDWAGGPYPVSGETDYLHFDLETGEFILMPDLIEGIKYFDFLREFWLDDCANSIRESHQCAHGNKTGDYESQEAFTLEGECEFQCHKMNHGFILSRESIFISNNSRCFPHVWQNCNTGASKYLKVSPLIDYLSDYGKWLLGLTDDYKPIKRIFHFVGKIDNRLKISVTLASSEDNLMEGIYFYWSQNKKITLKGQQKVGSEVLDLTEFVGKSKTGSFELEWDDFLYSTDGYWLNQTGDNKLKVELMNIYDYREREYSR